MSTAQEYERIARGWAQVMGLLARYHSWKIVGTENIPKEGGAVVTCTHSLASYDLFIMGCASRGILGRQAYIVGDELMFRLPGSEPVLHKLGYVPRVKREMVVQQLREGALLGIAPGGMRESLRDTRSDAYGFDWSDRLGFVWVAMKAGVPIVPIVCPRSNEIFTVYGNPLTDWVYRHLKVPLPLFRGLGPTLLPRPIKLVSVVGEPLYPDVPPDQVGDEDVARMHQRVVDVTRTLTEQALNLRAEDLEGPDVRSFPHG